METLFRLLPGPQPALIRFGVTAVVVFGAFALRAGMGEGTGRFGFIHFVLPIVASALIFDRAAGFFAVALSSGLIASIIPWGPATAGNISAIAVFVLVSGCLVFVSAGLHSALVKASAAQEATDLLLREMSHRVKNKFGMISSIIALQARTSDPQTRRALEDVATRVNVIATVHNYLQLSRHDGLIDVEEYLQGLCKALREALCGHRPITIGVWSVRTQMPAEKALAMGLIVNELVTNAFKYAFEGERAGHVHIELVEDGGDMLLSVSDNGGGRPADSASGLGTRLVSVFAAQLGGTAAWDNQTGNAGCKATIRFPR